MYKKHTIGDKFGRGLLSAHNPIFSMVAKNLKMRNEQISDTILKFEPFVKLERY